MPSKDTSGEEDTERIRAFARELAPVMSSWFHSIQVLPLPMPALLDFQFCSPHATLVLSTTLMFNDVLGVVRHEREHVKQQIQRFQRRRFVGCCGRLQLPSSGYRFASWDDVSTSRDAFPIRISDATRATLALRAPSCRRCRRPASELAWLHFVTPMESWFAMAGIAGWMAVCDPCQEQVSLFIDRQN